VRAQCGKFIALSLKGSWEMIAVEDIVRIFIGFEGKGDSVGVYPLAVQFRGGAAFLVPTINTGRRIWYSKASRGGKVRGGGGVGLGPKSGMECGFVQREKVMRWFKMGGALGGWPSRFGYRSREYMRCGREVPCVARKNGEVGALCTQTVGVVRSIKNDNTAKAEKYKNVGENDVWGAKMSLENIGTADIPGRRPAQNLGLSGLTVAQRGKGNRDGGERKQTGEEGGLYRVRGAEKRQHRQTQNRPTSHDLT